MSLALLFPGQGSQAVGMGKALLAESAAARAVFDEADDALGMKLSRIILEGPVDELKRTRVTQPAILTMSIACLRAAKERGLFDAHPPAYVAGHSLGEYSALVAAGAMAFDDAVRAVAARGAFMQEAVPEGEGAMGAVLGLDAKKIVDVIAETSRPGAYVACANFNGPDQTVIAGSVAGVANATAALKAAGAKRVLPLPVSAPFHCALMDPVRGRLDAVLAKISFSTPRVPVITNVEATSNTDVQRIRPLLVEQVIAPVRFTEMVSYLLDAGVDTFVELGRGKTLIGMVKRMTPDRPNVILRRIESPASLSVTIGVLSGELPPTVVSQEGGAQ